MYGGAGEDVMEGRLGNDTLRGGVNDDLLAGKSGERHAARRGVDTLFGGPGDGFCIVGAGGGSTASC